MEMTPVSSSSIDAIGFDEASSTLRIRFHNGSHYTFSGVSPEEHQALLRADSIGRHFGKHIRPNYAGRKEAA